MASKKELETFIENGFSLKRIGAIFGKSQTYARNLLKKYELSTLAQKISKPDGSFVERRFARRFDHDEAVRLYLSGLNTQEIADKFKVSRAGIRRTLMANNVKLRPQSESMRIRFLKTPNFAGFKRGNKNPAWGKRVSGSDFRGHKTCYGGKTFRSSFEAMFAAWCDEIGFSWTYEPRRYVLSDGSTYLPDFLVEGQMVEIKGWMTQDAQQKISLYTEQYGDLVVLRKNDLMELGVFEMHDRVRRFSSCQ